MITVFAYAFPHEKTSRGLQIIGKVHSEALVVAAPWVRVSARPSLSSEKASGETFPSAAELSREYGYHYVESPHNWQTFRDLFGGARENLGIVLGARILSKEVLSYFKNGVVNFHPGLLPENAGLFNLEWAILSGLPQAATAHFIDGTIDGGTLIRRQVLGHLSGFSSIKSLQTNLLEHQLMMLEALLVDPSGLSRSGPSLLANKKYRKPMAIELERVAIEQFSSYRENYASVLEKWQQTQLDPDFISRTKVLGNAKEGFPEPNHLSP